MISESYIKKLITEHLEEKSFFLVELRVKTDSSIRVFIDGFDGVKVADCRELSRHIESNLDREVEDFALDVSSAGLDLPLRVSQQFVKNIGRELHVVMVDGQVIEGEILAADDKGFKIQPKSKKLSKTQEKKGCEVMTPEVIEISYEAQKESKLIINF